MSDVEPPPPPPPPPPPGGYPSSSQPLPPQRSPGYPPQAYQPETYQQPLGQKPSPHWALTIISLFCFLVLGVIGVYFSSQVNTRWNAGNYQGARSASRTAQILGIVSVALAVIGIIAALATSGSGT